MFGNGDSGSTDNTCFSNNSFDTVDVELMYVDVRTRLSNVAIGNISIPLCLISHIKQGLLFPLDSFFRFLDNTDDDDDDDEQRHIAHFSSSSTAFSGISNLWILPTCGFVDCVFVDSCSARAVAIPRSTKTSSVTGPFTAVFDRYTRQLRPFTEGKRSVAPLYFLVKARPVIRRYCSVP